MKVKMLVLMLIPVIFIYSRIDANSPAQLVDQYKEGIKATSVELLENSIDESSVIIVKNNIVAKVNSYDKKEFLGLIQKKVLGSWKEDPSVKFLYEDGNNAAVKMENINGKVKYQSYVTCMKTGEEWKIVNVIIDISKVSE